ncbi:CHAT domain-containing protein [Solwaraspora sp. WMMD792]|uniref:CHAT domain-containing protein n=1 Tax=Solwaraspora sp. WMMD792 TaxID=3016099 RepID=UPI002417D16C|nr:CHAT domain-containing protein [Solwaraspora sp. WMMD792]MDG4769453.1 CHAT domain-containing protein [Solwaraspora sp. WMMD792]
MTAMAERPYGAGELDAALAELQRLPPGDPRWPTVRSLVRQRQLAEQIRAVADRYSAAKGRYPGDLLRELDALAAPAAEFPGVLMLYHTVRAVLATARTVQDGDSSAATGAADVNAALIAADRFAQQLRATAERYGRGLNEVDARLARDLPGIERQLRAQQIMLGLAASSGPGRDDEFLRLLEQLHDLLDQPGVRAEQRAMASDAKLAAALLAGMTGDQWQWDAATGLTDEQLAPLRARARTSHERDPLQPDRLLYGLALLMTSATDPGRLDEAVGEFHAAAAATSARSPFHAAIFAAFAGVGLFRRAELAGNQEAWDAARETLDAARRLAGGPQHPLWPVIGELLGVTERHRGQWTDAQQTELAGLDRYAWQVLLQPDVTAAAELARYAAGKAIELAHRNVSQNAVAEAVRALESGRGLILHSATELRSASDRLTSAGRADLARRWLAATDAAGLDGAPAELRREVLTALTDSPGDRASDALLHPPGLAEIRSALAALELDALVYLVPAPAPAFGAAVIVPVDGPPLAVLLPNLVTQRPPDVERYLRAVTDRDVVLAEPHREFQVQEADARLGDSLAGLCDWAWYAVIGPVLANCPPGRAAASVSPARTPRLALIPVGELTRVPWQAARRPDGVYALELAEFSQAVSARMLCEVAARPPVPARPVGLIVGDPDTADRAADLPYARAEAYAVQQSFYRGGRYVGRRPDGSVSRSGQGRKAEVRDWLLSTAPADGVMLHLACHGVIQVEPGAASSYLLLADGERLSAEEIIASLALRPDRQIGLVVLAACRTGVSGRGYDEAYSLGTTFLAVGARAVLSTQWSIPDGATSVLMFMFHHFLMVERRTVRDALRQAQLWMLDPDRRPPAAMPAVLRRQLRVSDPAAVVAWAGFTHWGH